jgi:branched-chain amino acid transport system substrate-binding protein
MSESKRTGFTPYPPRGVFYFLSNKSPLGDLEVKKIHGFIFMLLLMFLCTGRAFSQTSDNSSRTIKIGFLIQDSSCISAVQGAEVAINIANRKGGLNGRNFQLVVRSMEGPWGNGSKQAVNLIFEENVWALVGSHDGRNAHLVEQAATKSTVVFISVWSGDPTLSQAFVPWFFNCVPNDNQQAASLVKEIFEIKKFTKIAVVHGSDYDSEKSLHSFLNSVKISGKPEPAQYNIDDYNQKLNALTNKIRETGVSCIVLFCQPSASLKLIRQILQEKMGIPLFGSLMLLNENELSSGEIQEFDNRLSIPAGDCTGSSNLNFRQEFQKAFKNLPGMVASYSYDGMTILIEAIRNAGSSDRERIQKELEKIHYNGVTGLIQFDEKGNRMGNFEMMMVKNGIPVKWEKGIPR